MNLQRQKSQWVWPGLMVLGIFVVVSGAWIALRRGDAPATAPVAATASAKNDGPVSAAGFFEPMESTTHLGAPYLEGHPGIVAALKVKEGEQVHAGEVIAELAGKAQLEAAVHQAAARVSLQQVKLQQTQSAPKTSDVSALKAVIARSQSYFENAQAEYKRYAALRQTHDVSQSDLEAKHTAMEAAQQVTDEAKARLAGLSESHTQEVQAATSELQLAQAELERAQVNLAEVEIHAPIEGVVLHVYARPGEEVGQQGIVELARTAQMDVLAEIYETDIHRVKMGQSVDITSELLPVGTRLKGTVTQIGSEVGRSTIVANIVTSDQATFADGRVVHVRIRLADAQPAAGLIHGRVSVILHD